jgi:histidyl-tRNA synthetase
MASKAKFQAIRGTRDLLPPETALWNHVEQTAREVFGTYGFGEIRPPIFEPTELFARAVGGETDIVSKEMYSFPDHGLWGLEGLRTDMLRRSPDWSDPYSVEIFARLVDSLIEQSAAAISQGEMPKTPENERAIKQLRAASDRIATALVPQTAGMSEQTLGLYLDHIHNAAVALKFGDLVSLRPEATASVCRAYIEHNMQQLPQPVKLYYMGPMFRRERPQKGRYRQFYQIGAEVLETVRPDAAKEIAKELAKDAAVDAEVIEMLVNFFDRVGLQGTELSINSIGHAAENCRRGYVELLRSKLREVKDKLGADSQRRIETNPLRVLDSKLEHEQPIIATLPKIADHLCDECKAHYAELKRQLDLRGVKYVENWRLVRGLDYYMRTTFEITARGLGSQNAVCGGGRYDGLVELLGGPPTKGIGFAIGEDRLILSLQESAKAAESGKSQSPVTSHQFLSVYIAWMGERAYETAIRAAKTLRAAGISVELPPAELKFGKALERADKLGAKYALILGENEVQSGEWTLKTLADGSQQKLTEPQLLDFLRRP